jgi:hypothetical protein
MQATLSKYYSIAISTMTPNMFFMSMPQPGF